MKTLISATAIATCLVALSAHAQECNFNNWDARGTYTMSGSGWTDLSKLVPSAPKGLVPRSWVGALVLDGLGGGTGWVSANQGGVQTTIQLVNLKYSVNADCSTQLTFSMLIKQLGITVGPVARIAVPTIARGQDLELRGMWLGAGPGSDVDTFVARRIFM